MAKQTRWFIIAVVIVLSLCTSLVAPAMASRCTEIKAAGAAGGIFDGTPRVAIRIIDLEAGVACYASMSSWGADPGPLQCLKYR